MDAPLIAVSPIAAQCPPRVPQRRSDDDTRDLLALVFEADQRAPHGDTPHETARAVDGVDDPAVAGGARLVANLFPKKTIMGKRPEKVVAQKLLRFTIGDGDRTVVL